MSTELNSIRNIGIAAHVDAGKTTLTERILFYTGASYRIGEVHDASAHMDYLPEEREHGITITTAVTKCPWNDHLIQIVDTPGHVDFTIEVERSMRVLDGAVIVMDGVRGVEPQTETVWRQANSFDIPRIIFINKMDKPGADFERAMGSVESRLNGRPVAVCMPLEDKSLLHLVEQKHIRFEGEHGEIVHIDPVPEELSDKLEENREMLIIEASEFDEELAEMDPSSITADQLWSALRQGTISGEIQPVFGGSALRNWGVQPLLDGVLKLLPSPTEKPPSIAKDKAGNEEFIEMKDEGPMIALAFKVQLLEGRRHVFARIYRGKLLPGDKVAIAGKDKEERVARIFDIDADTKSRLDEAKAGQIVLLAGLRDATTGDTLYIKSDKELFLESIQAKDPVLGLAIEPESTKDEAKMLEAIAKVCEEDPTVRFEEDEETGQRILRGMGELHLQIIFERIQREFNLKLNAGKPRVTMRETVTKSGFADITIDRILKAGEKELHLKARVKASATPNERGGGTHITFEPIILPGDAKIKNDQLEAARLGAQDSTIGGPIEGAPLEDVLIHIDEIELFGEYSSVQALRMCAAQAVRQALVNSGGTKLEPIMRIEVVVPDEYVGNVLGDLQSRNAVITGQDTEMGMSSLLGECPLASLLGYMTDLRSRTKGRGTFSMEFLRFDSMS